MAKKEIRVFIKNCFLMGKNTVEAKQWLYKRYGDSAPGKSTIIDWYVEFKRGRTNTDDAERSGRPKSAVVLGNITKVHKIVSGDLKLRLREIADTLKISEGNVFKILHESLGMRKLFSKWVSRLLTPDQKTKTRWGFRALFGSVQARSNAFSVSVCDNGWNMDPDKKRSLAEWTEADESRPKRPKTQKLAGKVMASLFWDAHGVLFIDYLEKGKTIKSDFHMALLNRLSAEIKKKRPHMWKKKVLFSQDNALCYKSIKMMVKLNELSFELLPRPSYSPNMAPQWLLALCWLEEILQGKRFASNKEVIAESEAYFESKDESFYKKDIEKLEKRWNECITLEGNYADE